VFAASVTSFDTDQPLRGLRLGEHAEPELPDDGWTVVTVRATALNHHDLWSLKGVGLGVERLPMILGTDASGVDDEGNEVVVHAVIGDPGRGGGDETLDPKRSLLSEVYNGALAERVAVPQRNLVPKPAGLSFEQAACLPTAWLTAYRMLTTRGQVSAGETMLVQGAGGGVSTALIPLAKAMGVRVWVTSRDASKREQAVALGADDAFDAGVRLPERVDVVMESVGAATWSHSLKSLRPGGRVVVCGATSGPNPPADLARVFFLQLSVIGSTMGTRDELEQMLRFCDEHRLTPLIDHTYPLTEADHALARLASGEGFGKIVVTVSGSDSGRGGAARDRSTGSDRYQR
jgi:NADPH:quinone reductase-like Zn-dependent oxidoreductase